MEDIKQLLSVFAPLLSLTLLWGLLIGLEAHRHEPIPVKKHGRKAISFVRLGLDHL